VAGAISNPYAGANRVRFKGFPRCRSAQRFLSPLSGISLERATFNAATPMGSRGGKKTAGMLSTAVSWNKCCRVAKGAGRSKQLLVCEMRLCPTLVVVLENLL